MTTDPFEALQLPGEPIRPATAFTQGLRARLVDALGLSRPTPDLPLIDLPPRRTPMSTATADPAGLGLDPTAPPGLTPYLAVNDGAAALAFYATAFDATEVMRIVGDDGRIGHAELRIGRVRLYLSDEYPDLGVTSPRTLGGTGVSLHLEVADVDAVFARAVAAGAEAHREPADQPYGSRAATVLDPFGHRWMLDQPLAALSNDELAARMGDDGWRVDTPGDGDRAAADRDLAGASGPRHGVGQIWAGVVSHDAPALVRFLVEVFGFEAQLVVEDDPGVVEHSQIRWPEGGIVMVSTADREGNVFSHRPVGRENLYVVTADPAAVHRRCVAAGVGMVLEPSSPDYDPAGMSFTVADPDGNLWTFGTYAGEPDSGA